MAHIGRYSETIKIVATESPEPPSLSTMYVAYTCEACGALVRDRGYHDLFWQALESILTSVDDRITRMIEGSLFNDGPDV